MVGGSVGVREIECVDYIVPRFTKEERKPAGKLRVEEKFTQPPARYA